MTLTLDTLIGYDPMAPYTGAPERWFCCPLPKCKAYPVDPMHRVLLVNVTSGLWCCNRCNRTGVLSELRDTWRPTPRQTPEKAPLVETTTPTAPEPQEWTHEDQGAYEAALAEIAEALPALELIEWLMGHYGCALSLDARGKLRAADAIKVPVPIRSVVTRRQEALVAALAAGSTGGGGAQTTLEFSSG
jgi:hypothetical protein